MTIKSEDSAPSNYSVRTLNRRPRVVTVLGWFWCVLGALVLTIGLGALLIAINFSSMNPYGYKDWEPTIISGIGIMLAVGVASILVGYDLLQAKRRMWKIAVVISLLYIALGTSAIFAITQGWFSGMVSPTISNAMRVVACIAAGIVLITLLTKKSVREYYGIHYESKKGAIISTCIIVAIVVVPTATAFIGFAYAIGTFATHTADDMDKMRYDELYALNSPAGAKNGLSKLICQHHVMSGGQRL